VRPDCPIAVIIPELVKEHWWEYLLHSYRAAAAHGVAARRRPQPRGRHGALGARRAAPGGGDRKGGAEIVFARGAFLATGSRNRAGRVIGQTCPTRLLRIPTYQS
jgi:hypothetical protein